jgi:predicted Zn-dependent protease
VCGECGNAPGAYACEGCGSAPAPQETEDDARESEKDRDEGLARLEKRIPAGSAKSHFYVVPLGREFPEDVADAVFQALEAFLYGKQVHLLPPMDDRGWDFEGLPLPELILPHTEDPVALRAKRSRAKKQREARERKARREAEKQQQQQQQQHGNSNSDGSAGFARGDSRGSTKTPNSTMSSSSSSSSRKPASSSRQSTSTTSSRTSQLSATAVLDALHHRLQHHWHGADNAFVVIALTMRDLCDPAGVGKGIEALERLAHKLDHVQAQRSENAGVLRRAMMEGDGETQRAAQNTAKACTRQIDEIVAERTFLQDKLRERAKYVVASTDLERRVSVLSFFRYHPSLERTSLHSKPPAHEDTQVVIRRACKMVVHAVCEMFGMQHCVYFHCRMNGSATMEQQDLSPMHLCPVCLRKLLHAIGVHTTPRVIERYFRLQTLTGGIYKDCFGKDASRWFKQRGATIEMAC